MAELRQEEEQIRRVMDSLSTGEVIGSGNYGTIYKIEFDHKILACKVTHKSCLALEGTRKEVERLKELRKFLPHPHLVDVR